MSQRLRGNAAKVTMSFMTDDGEVLMTSVQELHNEWEGRQTSGNKINLVWFVSAKKGVLV